MKRMASFLKIYQDRGQGRDRGGRGKAGAGEKEKVSLPACLPVLCAPPAFLPPSHACLCLPSHPLTLSASSLLFSQQQEEDRMGGSLPSLPFSLFLFSHCYFFLPSNYIFLALCLLSHFSLPINSTYPSNFSCNMAFSLFTFSFFFSPLHALPAFLRKPALAQGGGRREEVEEQEDMHGNTSLPATALHTAHTFPFLLLLSLLSPFSALFCSSLFPSHHPYTYMPPPHIPPPYLFLTYL